jgi:hypothetical protein
VSESTAVAYRQLGVELYQEVNEHEVRAFGTLHQRCRLHQRLDTKFEERRPDVKYEVQVVVAFAKR